MSDDRSTTIVEEEPSFESDPYERNWIRISLLLLVAFAVVVAVSGYALGFQVPGDESRVDPLTVTDSGPFSTPGLRDLGNGKYDLYIVSSAWTYEPNSVTVPVDSEVTFYVTSTDVQHGFKLQDTNINMQVLPGQVSTLTATFDKAGEHSFICTEFCGVGHAAMAGTLIVEEAAE